MLRTLASMVPGTHFLKLLFLTRYINCSYIFLACPSGKVPSEVRRKGGIAIDISQPFRLLAKLAATFPFREDIMIY